MKKLRPTCLWIFTLLLLPLILSAQQGERLKYVLPQDSIFLDTLTLVPGSVKIIQAGKPLDTARYHIFYANSLLVFKNISHLDTHRLEIQYRCFPINLSRPYYHKSRAIISDSVPNYWAYQRSTSRQKQNRDVFGLEGFQKSGNITRGFSAGNSQNLSLTSDLNLQLAGMLSPGLRLTASITDNNIPIQPDGNTQQLQDFDQVFIRLDHKYFSLDAGDFTTTKRDLTFLQYTKKSQGAFARVQLPSEKHSWTTYAGAAISRGKYHRFKFLGIEGNQGPYRLQGANNERYIVVLSGTERVYMDGKLLSRGETADYIIDYNTAQITFMPRVLVTKDKRFEVEFEYSEQNYSRAAVMGGLAYSTERLKVAMDVYSESDLRSQSIEPLSDAEKDRMALIGDRLDEAYFLSIDSGAFLEDRINYAMVDTLGYDSVFVYSTNPSVAHYQLSFSLVGQGKGDYIAVNTAANGKVYQWIAPVNGVPQGAYAPIKVLVTPKKKQVVNTSLKLKVGKFSQLKTELAFSVNDLNTFSSRDANDDHGVAGLVGFQDKRPLSTKKDPWVLESGVEYQFLSEYYNPVERIRSIEFERQWNGLSALDNLNEHLAMGNLALSKKGVGFLSYSGQKMYRSVDFQGFKNNGKLDIQKNNWRIQGQGAYSNTFQKPLDITFIMHQLTVSKRFSFIELGLNEFSEGRMYKDTLSAALLNGSFRFNEYTAFAQSADSSRLHYRVSYKYRDDFVPDSNRFKTQTTAGDLIAELAFRPNRQQHIKAILTQRNLKIPDTSITSIAPENTSQMRLEYQFNAWKGLFRMNTFYETNAGLEVKKEYSYLKVADGQGVYSWIDYNENGVKELNEFEVAAFQDQASYIRILLPTDEYIKTYGSRYNLVLYLQPSAKYLRAKQKWKRFLARFSNNAMYNTQLRTTAANLSTRANPVWVDINDTALVHISSYFRNSFFFNRGNPHFGLEWNYNQNRNKLLMVNGYEGREQQKHELKLRWNLSRKWMVESNGELGQRSAFSEFFNSRDFRINFIKPALKLTWQANRQYRVSLRYAYSEKENTLSDAHEQAAGHELQLMMRLNRPQQGNLSLGFNVIHFDYNADQNNTLAFEMMEGYRTGTNYRWNLSYNRTLMNNLQLTLIYDGRKSPEVNTIHTGSVQLRAYF